MTCRRRLSKEPANWYRCAVRAGLRFQYREDRGRRSMGCGCSDTAGGRQTWLKSATKVNAGGDLAGLPRGARKRERRAGDPARHVWFA